MIAVVIPVFNQAAYIGQALDSVAAQTLAPAEIVVVDDGSTDGSGRIARARGIRTVRIEHGGVALARRVGAEATSAPLLAFLDGDDLLEPRHHELLAAAAEGRDGAVGMVGEFAEPGTGAEVRFEVRTEPRLARRAGSQLLRRARYLQAVAESTDAEHDWFAIAQRGSYAAVHELVLRRRVHGRNSSLQDRAALHRMYLASARAAVLRSRGRSPS